MSLTGLTRLLKATPSLGKAVDLATEGPGPLTIELRVQGAFIYVGTGAGPRRDGRRT